MNVHAMNQLYAEQMVSDYLRNEGLLYKYVIATSSDFLFMNEFNNSLLRSIPQNSVMTSIQQNGANGYTNGFYVGMVSSVMKIMNRLHDIKNITTQVRDYAALCVCFPQHKTYSNSSMVFYESESKLPSCLACPVYESNRTKSTNKIVL